MAVYEYRCRVCDTRFEARRPMSEARAPINCPEGHSETTRLLSIFASPAMASPRGQRDDAVAFSGCGAGCRCVS